MSRFPGRVTWTIAAVAFVVAMADVAEAQREGGRRGGRGFGRGGGFAISSVQLVAQAEEVQAALNLTDEQKTKVEEIDDQLREDRRDLFQQGGGGDFRAMRDEMEKLNQEASAKLAEVLDEGQQKRLMGILIQVNGASSLLDAAVAKELVVTEDQKTKLSEVRDENMEAMREAMRDLRDQDLSREEIAAKMQELRTESDKKFLAVLTPAQQTQYEELKGDPVEIDRSQFRGFGGRGFGGGRGGRDRDRDNGDRDNDGV
jgi:Spy/CpxP family protein refolding chaperone